MKYSVDKQDNNAKRTIAREFELYTGMDGASSLTLHLIIDTETSEFTGSARVSQATNPPLDVPSNVSGHIITYLVQGAPVSLFIGGGYLLNTPLYENLNFTFDQGGSNTGCFKYKESLTGPWIKINDAKVEEIK